MNEQIEQPEKDEDDGAEFRCVYCNMPTLHYMPFTHYLGDDGYWVEDPYGDDYWVDEEEEEGYMCETCGSHCNVEEVYWWYPGDPEPWDDDDDDDDDPWHDVIAYGPDPDEG